MADSFIPRPDHQALAWMSAFSTVLSSSPETFLISQADADSIEAAVLSFAAALAVTDVVQTRTQGTVNAKDTARNAAESLCRQYAVQIKYNNGISDQSKIEAGVRPVNESRTPIFCPQTSPLVNVTAATPGSHTLRYADSFEPDKKAKPAGAVAIALYAYIGEGPTVNEDEAEFMGLYTKNPIVVAFQPDDDGKMATYFTRWSGKRGDMGPYSLAVSMRIAA